MLTVVAATGAWFLKHRVSPVPAGTRTVAVLPLENREKDEKIEYLRFALADEISNALTHAHSLELRPSASTQKFANGELDPIKAGRELGVGTVVTGHLTSQDKTVRVTLEAVEVKDDRVIWTGMFQGPQDNLISLQNQMAKKVRTELIPALGVNPNAVESSSAPVNKEAYEAFLHTSGMSHEGQVNKDAIAALEKVVAVDPNYAPAWEALGRRYYFDAIYAGGGAAGYTNSNGAFRHALALEPGLVGAAGFLATNEVESGDLDKAYQDAQALVGRRPDSAYAHYSLGYVARYAGQLNRAESECDKALEIDPRNYNWRSCSFAFFELGKPARAMDYLAVDPGTEWSNAVRVTVLMRQGKIPEAQQAARQMTQTPTWMPQILQACLNKQPQTEIHRLAELAQNELLPEQDSELKYYQGAILAACGEKQIAYAFLQKAVAQNYCAYQALQSDPLLASMREDAEFRRISQSAAQCQQKFDAAQGTAR